MPELVPLAGFEGDVQAEYERREDSESGGGDRFYAELERGLRQLCVFPNSGSRIKGTAIRRLLVCGSRFAVIHVPEHRGVVLHALLDLLANPDLNARRIRQITQRLSQP
ncbi:MAG TPA: hypothetical protein VEO95_11585 [Chthoniobacteraceae bacterium]|nr:hypothetical protein [Chthoniobacteraceae bacterium]